MKFIIGEVILRLQLKNLMTDHVGNVGDSAEVVKNNLHKHSNLIST